MAEENIALLLSGCNEHSAPPHEFRPCNHRLKLKQLLDDLQAGRSKAVVEDLLAKPHLAWMRTEPRGDFPIHVACSLVSQLPPCANLPLQVSGRNLLICEGVLRHFKLAVALLVGHDGSGYKRS